MLETGLVENRLEAGCDEAGRGCLAGPVCAAAVILKPGSRIEGLNDSKKLTEKQRDNLRTVIEKEALAWAVAMIWQHEIDEINILNASIKAMHQALAELKTSPEFILVDGNRFKPFKDIPYQTIIKGDGKFLSIAAASILAKTHRDEYMLNIHNAFPVYNWKKNKGYPTPEHRSAIGLHGRCEHHRQSFKFKPKQLQLWN